ncbi:tyrosine-type recombinase/integrase [Ancylobacter sp. VNQ12]|uniref:tyrosine-type recombinase/integrase n=1 Tax=Ancylobacter sp. VNQ12 TaxID=3400920 RepID=UPI003C01A02C
MRCYHRSSRTPVDLAKAPIGTAAFFAECSRITALQERACTTRPGTLGALIKEYRGSKDFLERLTRTTRAGYQRVFDYLKPIEDTPLTRFTSPFVVKLRDKAEAKHKRWFANYLKTVLSLLFAWGKERGHMKDNPAEGIRSIRRPKGLPKQNRRWTDDERHAVLDAAPAHMLPALALMMFTGLGPKDALTLPRTAYAEGRINTSRSKTEEGVIWPVIDPLRDILAAAPAHSAITLCANSRGRPWTVSGFNSSWMKLQHTLEKAGAIGEGLTLYGLRHTVAAILRESGADLRTIADALGQKTEAMAQMYSQGSDLSKKMDEVAGRFGHEVNSRRTKAVKPGQKK